MCTRVFSSTNIRLTPTRLGIVAATAMLTFTFGATSAEAQVSACSRIIELSKLRNETVTDSQSFAQYQRDFCRDYRSYKSSGQAMSAGGSYGPISADFGQSSSSIDSVASRYCENDGSVKSTADAYRQYIESIAPGAFESYNNCINLGKNNIEFTLPPTAIQPTNATFIVSNTDPKATSFDKIRYRAAPGINCQWDRPGASNEIQLRGQSAATLNCSRASADRTGYIIMYATTIPSSAVTVAWDEYQGGAPMSVVRQLQTATAEMTALRDSLRAAVVSFNATTCPNGWDPYVPAQGRFIRGINPTGDTSLDPAGTRAPGNIQADELRSHTHTHLQMVPVYDGVDSTVVNSGDHENQPRTTGATGGSETRPKNVALLYCQSR